MDTSTFTQKAGPLPVWGWSVLVVGVSYLLYKKVAANKTNANTTDTSTASDPLNNPAFYDPAILAASYNLSNDLGLLNSQVASNTNAVSTNTAATLRDVNTDTPVKTSARPPKYVQTYKTVKGDTLANISTRTFGTTNNWWSIWSYNTSLKNNPAAAIKPGTTIRIPHP